MIMMTTATIECCAGVASSGWVSHDASLLLCWLKALLQGAVVGEETRYVHREPPPPPPPPSSPSPPPSPPPPSPPSSSPSSSSQLAATTCRTLKPWHPLSPPLLSLLQPKWCVSIKPISAPSFIKMHSQVVLAATHIDTNVALAEAAVGPYAPSAALQLFGAKILAKITSRQVE